MLNRAIEVTVDEEKVNSAKQLDGCYVLVTDLDQKDCSAEKDGSPVRNVFAEDGPSKI